MARIKTYKLDDNVTGSDMWIGTDGNDASKTKNFSPTYLANYLNQNEVIDVSNSIRFTYDTIDSGKSRKSGTLSFATEIGAVVPINSITTFILSKNTQSTKLVNAFLNILPGTKIILQKSDYINIFGIFKVVGVTQITLEPDFYTVVVEYISGYGSLEEDKDYIISLIDLQGGSGDIPTKTSDLTNDGADGVNPFITLEDLPPLPLTILSALPFTTDHLAITNNQYVIGDVVYYLGGVYKCLANNDSIIPTSTLYWENVGPGFPIVQQPIDWDSTSGNNQILNKPAVTIPNFQQVTDVGNTTTKPIFTGNIMATDINGGEPPFAGVYNATNGYLLMQFDDTDSGFSTNFSVSPLTAGNSIVIPDASGTIALTTDITNKVPYTGATQDVNLGEFGLLTGNIEFDNTPTNIPTTAGSMVWNDTDGTVDLKLKGGNVTLQIGQEQVLRVVNKTATNINLLEANYQAVRVTGAQGQRLKVDLAQATNDLLSAETIGLVTETINDNQEGFITTSGLIRGVNTTGSLQSETWADGDILYLSPTVAGQVTKVKPVAPNHLVIIGYVVSAHITQGSIFVKVDNGYELDELHNVKIAIPLNNNVLAYTSATEIWENKTVDAALGFTPANDSAVVHNTGNETIDGVKTFSSNLIMPGTGIPKILIVESSGQISGIDTDTYPTLTELANVKGVISPIQTQLDLKQYTIFCVVGQFSMADASTYFFSPLGGTGGSLFTASTNLDFSSVNANILNRIYFQTVNGGGTTGTSENVSLYFRNITTATSTLIGTFRTNTSTFLKFDFTSINISIPANNLWCLEIRTPTWVTNPTLTNFRITSFLTQ